MAILSQSRSELPPSSDSVDTESARVSQDLERTGEDEVERRVWRGPSSGGSDRVKDPCARRTPGNRDGAKMVVGSDVREAVDQKGLISDYVMSS